MHSMHNAHHCRCHPWPAAACCLPPSLAPRPNPGAHQVWRHQQAPLAPHPHAHHALVNAWQCTARGVWRLAHIKPKRRATSHPDALPAHANNDSTLM